MHEERMENELSSGGGRTGRPADPRPSLQGTFGAFSAGPQLEYNPLNVAVGDNLRLHEMELAGFEVEVEQILGTTITYDGTRYQLTDYVVVGECTPELRHFADVDGKIHIRLRCEQDDWGRLEVTAFQAQHLEAGATLSFESLAGIESDVSLRSSRGGYEYGFERIGRVYAVFQGQRVVVAGSGTDGGTSSHLIESLDYVREQRESDGRSYNQWALVEYNPQTMDMITLFGWSVDPYSIERVRK